MTAKEIADFSEGVWSLNHSGHGPTYTYTERLNLTQAALDNVPDGGLIVEIGVYAGSSLSCLLQVARLKRARVLCVDPFLYNGAEAELHLRQVLCQFPDVNWRFYPTTSEVAEKSLTFQQEIGVNIDFLHIDGDHLDGATDCRLWLPHLKQNGIAAFHDIIPDQRSSIYQLYLDVTAATEGWPVLVWELKDNCMKVMRKP